MILSIDVCLDPMPMRVAFLGPEGGGAGEGLQGAALDKRTSAYNGTKEGFTNSSGVADYGRRESMPAT